MANYYVRLPKTGGTGVTSLNTLTGALTLVAGSNITITPSGSNLTIASTGSGSVSSVSVVSANGLAGTVANPTTTPALTLSTTVTGILKGNGTAISAAIAADFPTLDQNTTGTAAAFTGNLTGPVTSVGMATAIANGAISNAMLANADVANLSGTNTGDQTNISGSAATFTGSLTGPVTSTGMATAIANGAISNAMLDTVNSNVGTFGSASSTLSTTTNAQGRITAVSSTAIQIAESQVTNLTSDLTRINVGSSLFNYYNFF